MPAKPLRSKTFEDLGYQAVDNLPLELLPEFAGLVAKSAEIERAAIVVDVREGQTLDRFQTSSSASSRCCLRAWSFLTRRTRYWCGATRRHVAPILCGGRRRFLVPSWKSGRLLDSIRNVADTLIDTSKFNVHELRSHIQSRFGHEDQSKQLLVSCLSFGFKNGVPLDADLVFDVRFLPNPHFVPEFHDKTGLDPKVAAYVRGFPQTEEFLKKVTDLMLYLLPHYVGEGKSYLTVAFGCTGGQHRSVMMAEEMTKRLNKAGYKVKALHRDMPRKA